MPEQESFRQIAEQIVAGMSAEERRAMLHVVSGDARHHAETGEMPSPFDAMFDAMVTGEFRNPEPDVGPVPAETVGFRIRLDLKDTRPPVWRRLELPGDITLDRLHVVIQAAMGWTDSHLHHFRGGSDPRAGYFLSRYDIEQEGEEGIDEADVRLDQVVAATGDKLWYEYDFGDGWEHVLAVEEVLGAPPEKPSVLGGKNACPPEDCGGVWGYSELAAWVRGGYDESSVPEPFSSADDARGWLPPGWHPDHFDVAEMQQWLDQELAPTVAIPDELDLLRCHLQIRGDDSLTDLVAAAADRDRDAAHGLADPTEPAEEQAAAAVRSFVEVLDVVGAGLKLTAAGYLPPAVVSELAARTGVAEWWIGKMNREDQTFPIHQLRSVTRRLGLVSLRNGVLAPTAAAKRCRGNPLALWRHIVSRLPMGRQEFDRHAGWVSLAVVAAGTEPRRWDDAIQSILRQIGWRSAAGDSAYLHIMTPTLSALEVMAGYVPLRGPGRDENAAAAAEMAARAVLFRGNAGGKR